MGLRDTFSFRKGGDRNMGANGVPNQPNVISRLPLASLHDLHPDAVRNLTLDELLGLEPQRLAMLPIGFLAEQRPEVLARLPPGTISMLPPSARARIDPEIMRDRLAHVHMRDLETYPADMLARLPRETIMILPIPVQEQIDPKILAKMKFEAIRRLSNETFTSVLQAHPSLLDCCSRSDLMRVPLDILQDMPKTEKTTRALEAKLSGNRDDEYERVNSILKSKNARTPEEQRPKEPSPQDFYVTNSPGREWDEYAKPTSPLATFTEPALSTRRRVTRERPPAAFENNKTSFFSRASSRDVINRRPLNSPESVQPLQRRPSHSHAERSPVRNDRDRDQHRRERREKEREKDRAKEQDRDRGKETTREERQEPDREKDRERDRERPRRESRYSPENQRRDQSPDSFGSDFGGDLNGKRSGNLDNKDQRHILAMKEEIADFQEDLGNSNKEINRLKVELKVTKLNAKQLLDERKDMNDEIAELKAAKASTKKSLHAFLKESNVKVEDDEDDDPAFAVLRYAKKWLEKGRAHHRRAQELEDQLAAERGKTESINQELQQANDELLALRHQAGDLDRWRVANQRLKESEDFYRLELGKSQNEVRVLTERLRQWDATLSQQLDEKTAPLLADLRTLKDKLQSQENRHAFDLRTDRERGEKLVREKQRELELVKEEARAALDKKEAEHDIALGAREALRKSESEKREQECERKLYELALHHSRDVVYLKERITSLEGDLMDNSDDFRPATDDMVRLRYEDLKLAVGRVAEPTFLGQNLRASQLDTTGFLERNGKNQLRFLLRSIVWQKVMEGFFSAPFGFGALGPGEGKKMLDGVYQAWRKIFDSGPTAGYYDQEDMYAIFATDKEANRWRSATFQSILMAAIPRSQRRGEVAEEGMVQRFNSNRKQVHKALHGLLDEVCPNGISDEIEEELGHIVRIASELALEFGSQRSHLDLEGAESGETVQFGDNFIDCANGDGYGGRDEAKVVDLVVSPRLFRVGDGRNDLEIEKVIVPGEIYPRKAGR